MLFKYDQKGQDKDRGLSLLLNICHTYSDLSAKHRVSGKLTCQDPLYIKQLYSELHQANSPSF